MFERPGESHEGVGRKKIESYQRGTDPTGSLSATQECRDTN